LKYRWLIWVGYLALWTVGLLMPMSGQEAKWEIGDVNLRVLFAKSLHVAAYAVLAMLTGWLLVPGRFRWLLLLMLAAHATGTEYIQQFVEGRTGRIEDIGIDLFGVLLGCLVTWKLWTDPK
jgi:hypothetical protein